jgi:hypothetical protein
VDPLCLFQRYLLAGINAFHSFSQCRLVYGIALLGPMMQVSRGEKSLFFRHPVNVVPDFCCAHKSSLKDLPRIARGF